MAFGTVVPARSPKADTKAAAEVAGRAGLVARGTIYVVVAVLAVRIALGDGGGERADQRGALAELAQQPFGTVLLVLLAVGFGCYALWRLTRAWTGEESSDDPDAHHRLADIGRACIHLSLLASTIGILGGDSSGGGAGGGGGSDQGHTWTARLMQEGWGRWLVGAAGLAVAAGGLWLVRRGFTEKFRKHLERLTPWVVRLGVIGHVGRGLAFTIIGGFVVRAAVRFDPNEPIGLDEALRDLASSGWGRVVAVAVAVGLAGFGLFSIAEARDRRVLG
jgi:hypothetical protein